MRIRRAATVDRDSVSPDSMAAAAEYVIQAVAEAAEASLDRYGDHRPLAINWDTLHVYTRRNRRGEHRVIAWAKVIA